MLLAVTSLSDTNTLQKSLKRSLGIKLVYKFSKRGR